MLIDKKIIAKTIKGIVIGYIALIAVMYVGQRYLQYMPNRTYTSPSETVVPEMQEVSIQTADGFNNKSWLHLSADTKPVIVMFHGNSWNIAQRAPKARELLDGGYNLVITGYRGFGGNPGAPSEQGLYHDARAIIDYLQTNRGIPLARMVFYGESIGTGVAIRMAHEYQNIAGLILEVPFDSALKLAERRYPFVIGLSYLMLDQYPSDQLIGDLKMPKLFIVAGKDNVIPAKHAQALYDQAPNPKMMVELPLSGHNNTYSFGAGQKILDFLHILGPLQSQAPSPDQADDNKRQDDSAHSASDTFPMPQEIISIMSAGKERAQLNIEIASTPGQLERGLMDRTTLAKDGGMLFILPRNMIATFWMKDTLIPLDMLFIDQDGRIIKIHENAQPRDLTTISSDFQVRAVLEINAARARALNIQTGDVVLSRSLDQAAMMIDAGN